MENQFTSLGYYHYRRDYFGLACELATAERVVVATAVMQSRNGIAGSNLARLSPAILSSREMTRLLESGANTVRSQYALQALSERVAKETGAGIADVLNLEVARIERRLKDRASEQDHFDRFIEATSPPRRRDRYAILGFLLADVEHTLAEMSFVQQDVK